MRRRHAKRRGKKPSRPKYENKRRRRGVQIFRGELVGRIMCRLLRISDARRER